MSFIKTQSKESLREYLDSLGLIASLSNLFSESDIPFLHYRAAENIFCKSFDAVNASRGDIAFDAVKNGIGIGIKTFVLAGKSKLEKVAEFNSESSVLRNLKGEKKLEKLVELRNIRIAFAQRTYDITDSIYHCIGREKGILKIFEVPYRMIDIDSVKITEENDTKLSFKDKFNEYNYNVSKSTIYQRFHIPADTINIKIGILENPLQFLLSNKTAAGLVSEETKAKPTNEFVILPLYSPLLKKKGEEPVPERSQLNQWNAKGRPRDEGEVYIPIPKAVHKISPHFFPDKDVKFELVIPSGETLSAKVCQQGNKALMTNPNNALADWMLRKILMLKKHELLKYKRLAEIGVDSVRIEKISERKYAIEFARTDSYEEFVEDEIDD